MKKLAFFAGYAPDPTGEEMVYGSEQCLKRLSEELTRHYDVSVFGYFGPKVVNGVHYAHADSLHAFLRGNDVDVLVVMRYVHYFLEFTNTARTTYLWFQDPLAQPYWNDRALPRDGKHLVENLQDAIDGIVVLCDWHKQFLLGHYDIDPGQVHVIGNAIDAARFDRQVDKVHNRFIYTSNPVRGLKELVGHFHVIRRHIPDAELHVFRGLEEFQGGLLEELRRYPYIKFRGKVANEHIAEEWLRAEYWYYPTQWAETYCISALEAQMAGCVCVASDLAALRDTVGDRGVLLKQPLHSPAYWDEALHALLELHGNRALQKTYAARARAWAAQQTWPKRAEQWVQLFGKTA
jgi:glycosyltransferase involved in cell wall biosynthesis